MKTIQEFWNQYEEYSRQAFGPVGVCGPVNRLKHLAKGAAEAQRNPKNLEEYAACLFLIFDACGRAGFGFRDLERRIWQQFQPGLSVQPLNRLWLHVKAESRAFYGPPSLETVMEALKELAEEADGAVDRLSYIEVYAKCLALLFDACWRAGFSFQRLLEACWRKLKKNKARSWPGERRRNDPVEHLREGEFMNLAEWYEAINEKFRVMADLAPDDPRMSPAIVKQLFPEGPSCALTPETAEKVAKNLCQLVDVAEEVGEEFRARRRGRAQQGRPGKWLN